VSRTKNGVSRAGHRSRTLRWRDLCPPEPVRGAAEGEALRLALLVSLGVLQAGTFVADHQPLPGNYIDHLDWLWRTLAPLARHSLTIRTARRLIDLAGPRMRWDDGRALRRDLHRLAIAADRCGRHPAAQPMARP